MKIIKESIKDDNYRQLYLEIYNFMSDFSSEFEILKRSNNEDKLKMHAAIGRDKLWEYQRK